MGPQFVRLAAMAMFISPAAMAGQVEITKVSASSTYPPQAGAFYSANMVKDGKLGTSWVEGSPGAGLGQSITVEFGETEVTEVHVYAGMWYSTEFWNRANRPREVEIKAADGSKTLCQMTDEQVVQVCKLDSPTKTSSLTLTLKGSYSGTTWMDTGLSEILVQDSGPPSFHAVTGASASSELEDDGDGPYTAARAGDGMVDSMWCEGNDGDGTGEWLQIDLGAGKKLAEVEIVNGIGGSMTVWKKGNRAGKVTLTFSDGSTKSATLEDTHRPQSIPLGGKETSSVKLTVDSVVKGAEYNDLCISEIRAK